MIEEQNKGLLEAPKRIPLHFNLIVDCFKHYSPNKNAVTKAWELIRERSRAICNGIHERMDEDGLPLDRRDFNALEEDLARFVKILPYYLYRKLYQNELEISIEGQQNPNQVQIPSDRGKIENYIDPNHPIIGPYVQYLHDMSVKVGIPTDKLLHRNCKTDNKNQRETVMIDCLRVAKDMITLIGEERYNSIRKHIRFTFCRYYDADFFLSQPPHLSAALLMEQKSYWNSIPRAWVEELMILAANPELVDRLAKEKQRLNGKTTSEWAVYFARRDREITLPEKESHIDYVRRQLDAEIEDLSSFYYVLMGIQNIIQELARKKQKIPIIKEKEIEKNENIKTMKYFIKKFAEPCRSEQGLIKSLCKLVSIIQKYDGAYRKADKRAKQKEKGWHQFHYMEAARALAKSIDIEKLPLIETIEELLDDKTGFKFKFYINLSREGDQTIKISAFNTDPSKREFFFKGVSPEDLTDVFSKYPGRMDDKLLRGLQYFVKDLEKQCEQAKKNYNEHRLLSIEDPEQLFNIYRLIKYLFVVLQVLMNENLDDMSDELDMSVILNRTQKNSQAVMGE